MSKMGTLLGYLPVMKIRITGYMKEFYERITGIRLVGEHIWGIGRDQRVR